MPDLPPLADDDQLGRRVYSQRRAKRATRGTIVHDLFMPQGNDDSLSVDRLDHVPDQEMATIAQDTSNQSTKTFQGWAEITVDISNKSGRDVRETATFDNPYHADIHLNVPEGQYRKEILKQHAIELAAAADWRQSPFVNVEL